VRAILLIQFTQIAVTVITKLTKICSD